MIVLVGIKRRRKKSIIGAIKRHQTEDKEKLKEKKEASKEVER